MTSAALETVKVGDRVCVVGFGTASIVHEHHTVTRVTKLYIVSEADKGKHASERRHRRSDGQSPGGDGYGGTTVHLSCRKPRK